MVIMASNHWQWPAGHTQWRSGSKEWSFSSRIFSEPLWCVEQKGPGPEMKETMNLLITIIPSFHHIHLSLNNPSNSFYRGRLPINKRWNLYEYSLAFDDTFLFCGFAFKSFSKISPYIIQSFLWMQRNTQDLDLVKRKGKRTLKH